MHGTTVYAAMRNAHKRRQERQQSTPEDKTHPDEVDEQFDRAIAEPITDTLVRMEQIEAMLLEAQASKVFSLKETDGAKDPETQYAQVKGLIAMVEARIERSTNYRKLLGTCIFFLSYFLWLRCLDYGAGSNVSKRYEIENSIMTAVVGFLVL